MNHYTAQCGEDRWLDSNWRKLGLPDVGFFVEFGAADGRASSNTHWLEKAKGWRGLLIEADPRHTITDRSGCIVERRYAIGPAGIVSFGLDASDPCLSGIARPSDSRIEVECKPLSEVLDLHGVERVDLLSIDTEGTELEAWRTLDLSRWRPAVVLVELVTWGLPDRADEVIEAMRGDGYEMIKRTRYNGIFCDIQRKSRV